MSKPFKVVAKYEPAGDQPSAIKSLSEGLESGFDAQTLLGVTGSGKTYTIAKVIEKVQRPTLVIAHNKTLAAQLYNEFKDFFPENAVEYFVSYYDYYQPEAYIPRTDTYIEKTASVNDEIDRLRHSTTRSLYERRDVIVVASVSCIYGLGLPENYFKGSMKISVGEFIDRDELLRSLVKVQYERNDIEFKRGSFRARGDIVEIIPSYENMVIRIYFFGDEIEKLAKINPVTGEVMEICDTVVIFPAVHYVQTEENMDDILALIKNELEEKVQEFKSQNKILEAQRLKQRTMHDLEMLKEVGYCNGIENYSRIIEKREPESPPSTLIEYFPKDFLLVVDESHVSLPQLRAMYNGDRARKNTLIDYGFRLPCAKDNRPLKAEEFWDRVGQKIFVSATPSDFEKNSSQQIVEQIIRPTGLLDPEIDIRPTENQVDDLIGEIKSRAKNKEKVLITTLTKKMAEDLTDYFLQMDIKVRYIHSEVCTLERVEILRDLRLGVFDVLIGVNLLREGLDLPEVTLVAIMDADKEGFLRSETSLIQTIGRAARNVSGKVIMYADKLTDSIKKAQYETERRRNIQAAHNTEHGIVPKTIIKDVQNNLLLAINSYRSIEDIVAEQMAENNISMKDLPKLVQKIEKQMHDAAKLLDFERATELRDRLKELRELVKLKE
jgi:excinuclease ABC subunit B